MSNNGNTGSNSDKMLNNSINQYKDIPVTQVFRKLYKQVLQDFEQVQIILGKSPLPINQAKIDTINSLIKGFEEAFVIVVHKGLESDPYLEIEARPVSNYDFYKTRNYKQSNEIYQLYLDVALPSVVGRGFFHHLQHELRNPLAIIKTNIYLIEKSDNQAKFAKAILDRMIYIKAFVHACADYEKQLFGS